MQRIHTTTATPENTRTETDPSHSVQQRTTRPQSGALRVLAAAVLVAGLVSTTGGCRICAECDTEDYAAFGSQWPRTIRNQGRVGSLFDPGGNESAETVNRDSTLKLDAQERARQAEGDPGINSGDLSDPDATLETEEQRRAREERLKNLKLEEIRFEYDAPIPTDVY